MHGLQNGCCVSRCESTLISTRALGWPGALSMSKNILKGIFFSWAVGLNSGLKIFRKPCCKQMRCYPGFVVPLMVHRPSRFSIILKNPRIFGMVNEHWLQLQGISCLSLLQESQPVLWGFEARHWLLLSSYESPRWHLLLIQDCFISIDKLLFGIATIIYYLS